MSEGKDSENEAWEDEDWEEVESDYDDEEEW